MLLQSGYVFAVTIFPDFNSFHILCSVLHLNISFFSEPDQNSVKYLTWHRTTSSRSSSSRNLIGPNSNANAEDASYNLFDNFCMVSGSHASTLDRLYAWEKKLYDEVKVCLYSRLLIREDAHKHELDFF